VNITTEDLGVKLAGALLLHHGEISMEDIRAMPFLMNPLEAEGVIRSLLEMFDIEISLRKVPSYPLPQWEKVMRIRDLA
jgi:hypothetical protein